MAEAPLVKRKALKIVYQPMHERNIHNVKMLVSTVLPVTYADSLFKRLLTYPQEFCKLGGLPRQQVPESLTSDTVGCIAKGAAHPGRFLAS
jgi:hypothetical protein